MTEEVDPARKAELERNLADPMWRLSNLYKIITKSDDGDGLVVLFRPNRAQRRLLARMHTRNVVLKARQLGYCLDPSTRVLTDDLRWIPIGEIQPGHGVVGVDEHAAGLGKGNMRKMREASVVATRRVLKQAYRITFDDGRQVVCTGEHRWLSKNVATAAEWRSIEHHNKRKLRVGHKVRSVTLPWGAPDAEDGWFAGMLDGEGSMSKNNVSPGVSVSQRQGPVWDRLVRYAQERGYHAHVEADSAERATKFGQEPVPKLAFGRMDELFRLIGQLRPTRFVDRRFWVDRVMPGRKHQDGTAWATITKIEKLEGHREMVDLQTTTGTFIAEGLVSHNSTLIAILWLDTALFAKAPMRCGVIAHERDAAETIFRDKVVFAYDNLPPAIKAMCPIESKTKTEIVFAHNKASIRVATSLRSATIHRLHISEFGKIAAKYPAKAREVMSGTIPSVPGDGLIVVESTAEGQDGPFYDLTQAAIALRDTGRPLTKKEYRLTFAPWWDAPEYEMDPYGVILTEAHTEYFNNLEKQIGRPLSLRKRAWYVSTLNTDFLGDQPMMWQEYPSTPAEAFAVSTEGCYYATQLAVARRDGRVRPGIPVEKVPCYTFWDLGRGDMTAVWVMQRVGPEFRWIRYYEESGYELDHYVDWLNKQKLIFGGHYLPHDAGVKRLGITPDTNKSLAEGLEELMPGHKVHVVPRVTNVYSGIQATRKIFATSWFDEEMCAQGIKRLQTYRKEWDKVRARWKDQPLHDDASHGADAFRQAGQVIDAGERFDGVAYKMGQGAVGPAAAGRRWPVARRGSGAMAA